MILTSLTPGLLLLFVLPLLLLLLLILLLLLWSRRQLRAGKHRVLPKLTLGKVLHFPAGRQKLRRGEGSGGARRLVRGRGAVAAAAASPCMPRLCWFSPSLL